jgi:hypothetical protein
VRRSLLATLSVAITALALLHVGEHAAQACCPAPPSGKPVVNADQTVVLVWDAANKTEHFIRRATFKSDAEDFGFLVPTPAQPELAESGDDAFPLFAKLTAPEEVRMARPSEGCNGCMRSKSVAISAAAPRPVAVLEEKTVAGFHAVVLEASSAKALVGWLEEHGYAFSPEVEAWAKPYVDGGWKITALRVAKDGATKDSRGVAAAALRMSFKTDRPLFPYREPDTTKAASALATNDRLLRIFFVGDARYQGELTGGTWTGNVAWSNKLSASDRDRAIGLLRLPPGAAAGDWWLTEFEDPWPYAKAPSDLYFARNPKQDVLKRPAVVVYTATDGASSDAALAVASAFAVPLLFRRRRKRNGG